MTKVVIDFEDLGAVDALGVLCWIGTTLRDVSAVLSPPHLDQRHVYTHPVVKLVGISLASNSYCNSTEIAYLAKVTDPKVATLGLTPAMPAIMKYVLVKSNRREKVRALMLLAALISANT